MAEKAGRMANNAALFVRTDFEQAVAAESCNFFHVAKSSAEKTVTL